MTEARHQVEEVAPHGACVVAAIRLVGDVETAWIGDDHSELPGQRHHHIAPYVPVLRPSPRQKQGRTCTAKDGVKGNLAGTQPATFEGVGESLRQAGRAVN